MAMNITNATPQQSPQMAYLINIAGEGLPYYFWSQNSAGRDPYAIGAERAARPESAFSYRNARVMQSGDKVVGMCLAYALPAPYELDQAEELPHVIRALKQLESKAAGHWYINALATDSDYRQQGIATQLMQDSFDLGRSRGCSRSSIIVLDDNQPAKALYLKLGYEELTRTESVPFPGAKHQGDWVLLSMRL